jgi:PAS domain S-box-containing protein
MVGDEQRVSIRRDVTKRMRVEEELMKHREQHERPAKEPATGLRMATEQLQQEMIERKHAERTVQKAREYAESIVETVREPLVVLDTHLRVISVNNSFCQTFKVTPEDAGGKLIYDLGNRQRNISKLHEYSWRRLFPGTHNFRILKLTMSFRRLDVERCCSMLAKYIAKASVLR